MPTTHAVPSGAAAMVWMIFSVEPDLVGGVDDLVAALGVHDDLDAGDLAARRLDGLDARTGRAPSSARATGSSAPSRSCSRVRPPFGRCGSQTHAVVEGQAELAHGGVAAEVLVGQEQHLAVPSTPPPGRTPTRRAVLALDDVQIVPPCRPVNALMAAEEFM